MSWWLGLWYFPTLMILILSFRSEQAQLEPALRNHDVVISKPPPAQPSFILWWWHLCIQQVQTPAEELAREGSLLQCMSVPHWCPCLRLTCIGQALCIASLFLQSLPSKQIFWRVQKRVWEQILSQSGRGQCCCGMHGRQGHSYPVCLHRLHCLKVMQSQKDLSWKGPLDNIWSKLLLQLCQDSQGHNQ